MKLKWFFSLLNILAVGLILVSLLALLMVVLTPPGQVPQVMGFSLLRVLSGSMEPEIPEQSMLLIRATEPEALAVGDIISFFSPDPSLNGALNTHRIAAIVQAEGDLEFVTKGDANFLEDPQRVSASRVVGKVIFVCPWLGKVIHLVSNPLIFGGAILLPLLLMLIGNLVAAMKSAARLAKEEEEAAIRQALENLRSTAAPGPDREEKGGNP